MGEGVKVLAGGHEPAVRRSHSSMTWTRHPPQVRQGGVAVAEYFFLKDFFTVNQFIKHNNGPTLGRDQLYDGLSCTPPSSPSPMEEGCQGVSWGLWPAVQRGQSRATWTRHPPSQARGSSHLGFVRTFWLPSRILAARSKCR